MGLFNKNKQNDLVTRRAKASQNLSKYERKYDNTYKDKYKDKAEYYKSEIVGIDKLLEKNTNKTNIKTSSNSVRVNNTKNYGSNNNLKFTKK